MKQDQKQDIQPLQEKGRKTSIIPLLQIPQEGVNQNDNQNDQFHEDQPLLQGSNIINIAKLQKFQDSVILTPKSNQLTPKSSNNRAGLQHSGKQKVSLFAKLDRGLTVVDGIENMADRKIKLNGRLFHYKGPNHPRINDLLNLLEDRQDQSPGDGFRQKMIDKWQVVLDWFKSKCIFFNGFFEITPYDVIIWLSFLAIYIGFLVQSLQLQQNTEVQQTNWKSSVAFNLPIYGAVFTIFKLLYIKVNNVFVHIIFCVGMTLIPTAVLLLYYLNLYGFYKTYNHDINQIINLMAIPVIYIFSLALNQIYQWIDSQFNVWITVLSKISLCFLLPYYITIQVVTLILTLKVYKAVSIFKSIYDLLWIPFIILAIMSWFFIQVRLFELPLHIIKLGIARLKAKILSHQLRAQPLKDVKYSFFSRYVNRIVATLIGLVYVGMELALAVTLYDEITKTLVDTKLCFTLAFEMISIMIFLSVGICISVSQRSLENTFLLIPLIVGAGPSFGFIYLNQYLISANNQLTSQVQNLILGGPTVLTLFWLSLSLFGIERRQLFMVSIGYLCYFFAIPLGVLLPIYQTSEYNFSWLSITAYVLLGIGIAGLIALIMFYIFQSLKTAYLNKKDKGVIFEFGEMAYYSLKDYASWLNAICFTIAFSLLSYFFWNYPKSMGKDEVGTIYALLIIHPILFVMINISLRLKSLDIEVISEYQEDEDPLFNLEFQEKMIENDRITQLIKYQKIFVVVGTVISFFVLLPIGLLSSSRVIRSMFIGLSIGIPICFLLFQVFIYIKNMSKTYQNFFQPFAISLSWCCIFFPFGVVVPIFAMQLNHSDSTFQYFIEIVVVGGFIVLMAGVTGISILLQILLDKEAFDKEMRYVTARIVIVLQDNAVLSDIESAGLIFEKYVQEYRNSNVIKASIMKSQIVGTEKYLGEDLRYDRKLISESRWKYLQKHTEQDEKKRLQEIEEMKLKQKEESEKSCLPCKLCLLDIVYCRFGIGIMESYQIKQDEEELLDLQQLTVVQDDETQQLIYLDDLLPDFRPVLREAQAMEQDYIDYKVTSLSEQLEMNPGLRKIKNQSKEKPIAFDKAESTRTAELSAIEARTLDPKIKKRLLMTDHGHSIKNAEEFIPEFLHMVFMEFCNNDASDPVVQNEVIEQPCIIYADLKEMFRLAGVMSKDERIGNQENLLQDLESSDKLANQLDLSEDDQDSGLITEDHLQELYSKGASQTWKNQVLALSEQDFAKVLIQMMRELLPDIKDSFEALREFTVEYLYPNLLLNINKFVLNLKPNNRAYLQKITKYDYNTCPFNQKNFNKVAAEAKLEVQKSKQKKQDQLLKLQNFKVEEDDEIIGNTSIVKKQLNYPTVKSSQNKVVPLSQDMIDKRKAIEEQYIMKVNCCRRCCYSICRCLHKVFWVYPAQCCTAIDNKLFGSFKKKEVAPIIIKKRVVQQRRSIMGHWHDVVNLMITTLVQASNDYILEKKEEQYKLKFNASNVIAVMGRISDLVGLANVAFQGDINWFGAQGQEKTDSFSLESFISSFYVYFYLSFGLSILYGILGNNAAEHSKNNTLGLDDDGNIAQFPHRQFLLVNAVGILGSGLFMLIMTTYIDTFVCIKGTKFSYVLLRSNNMECLGDSHILLIGLAMIGMGVYYPLSTFLFPEFQYGDKSLDLKYRSTYLVVYVQAKLLILGIGSFFQGFGTNAQLIQLVFSATIMILLIVFYIRMWPCYVIWFNYFELILMVMIMGLYFGAFAIRLTQKYYYGLIVAGIFFLFSFIAMAYLYFKSKSQSIEQPNQRTKIIGEVLQQEIRVTVKVNQGNILNVINLRQDIQQQVLQDQEIKQNTAADGNLQIKNDQDNQFSSTNQSHVNVKSVDLQKSTNK